MGLRLRGVGACLRWVGGCLRGAGIGARGAGIGARGAGMGARLRGAGVGARGAEARKLIRSRASAYACSVINPCLNSALSWLIGVSISLIITTLSRSICLVCVFL